MEVSTKEKTVHVMHWYQNDFGRWTFLFIGDIVKLKDDVRREFGKAYKGDMADELCNSLDELYRGFTTNGGDPARFGRCTYTPKGIAAMWFPVPPATSTLVHEILHSVQSIADDLGIDDDEYEAYSVQFLLEHFQEKLDEDRKKGKHKNTEGPRK